MKHLNRRQFLSANAALGAFWWLNQLSLPALGARAQGAGKEALQVRHFPNPLYAFVWRNWGLVPLDRMAKTVGANPRQISDLAFSMGLGDVPEVTADQWERSYLTVIRRNWHLLPTDQLQALLGWDAQQLEFTLKEDDFFYIKLGSMKPECRPITYAEMATLREDEKNRFISLLKAAFPDGIPAEQTPYFNFVRDLSTPVKTRIAGSPASAEGFHPRIAYPYFALFGDALLDPEIESYPDAYLERLAAAGVDSIWMHIVLSKLTPFPWDASVSTHWERRLANLKILTERVSRHGIGIYLYLNEPRHQQEAFFEKHPELRGQGNALCTSHPDVQEYLENSIALITERVPRLAGFFSITASENPTHCWSHGQGGNCPRCASLGPDKVISTLNNLYHRGIRRGYAAATGKDVTAGTPPKLIVWDWGWPEGWAAGIIPALATDNTLLMSVSEWDLEIERGGVKGKVGEYSISAIGPGPRARRHWKMAHEHGLKTMAKIQANNSWEISAVPYIPALFNVATHVDRLRREGIEGIMLSWTLGGYPSPNLEVVSLMGNHRDLSAEEAIQTVARRRFGKAADAVVRAWRTFSTHFSTFPYDGNVVYQAPLQCGPANLLWPEPTGYKATMVGLPYDDVTGWRSMYPVDVFIRLFRQMGDAFSGIVQKLNEECAALTLGTAEQEALRQERNVIETIAIHYQSVANQAEFVTLRDQLKTAGNDHGSTKQTLTAILEHEIELARRMAALQISDSRLGYEASNHYFYTSADLFEKILNCKYLLMNWVGRISTGEASF